MDPDAAPPDTAPSAFNYILSFLLVGIAWGFTTPFIRRAAVEFNARNEQKTQVERDVGGGRMTRGGSWIKRKLTSLFWTVVNLLRTPGYAVPLLLNLSGSVWFFLLVGKHELSLTVPITNSMAFLFTVVGEWYVEGKVISKQTGWGCYCLSGIALCVHSKNT
ncbi:integral membrane protein [Coccidioides immitis H538.4]|uniref:Integral membrane protein n=1 Tax=Coccidioides immitis H538.4 TaxID=396776 RepID=A0A0J8RQQ7_COCIT|nr:integral membrane protein [Coccidioides immitis H538.4]